MKLNLSNELDLDWSLPWKIRFAHGTDARKCTRCNTMRLYTCAFSEKKKTRRTYFRGNDS